jgi:hypothetical protein
MFCTLRRRKEILKNIGTHTTEAVEDDLDSCRGSSG